MVTVIFAANDGTMTQVDAPPGHTVMEVARANDIAGIVGECGGSMMCATCHVYVDPARIADLPPMGDTEDVMLDSTVCARRANSRLSCQLPVTPAIEGLVVEMPVEQV